MSYRLFVGSNDEYISRIARKHDPASELLVAEQVARAGKTYYTSLPDMENLKNFLYVCSNADHITYVPPKHWNSQPQQRDQQYWTEYVLTNISQTVAVDNLPNYKKKYSLNPHTIDQYNTLSQRDKNLLSIEPLDIRKSNDRQIWAVGDSITFGIGVALEETWREKVKKKLNLPLSNLSENGTSICWAANQILQSDVREGDYVLWGLTSPHRFLTVDSSSESIVHLHLDNYKNKHKNKFSLEYLDSDTTIMHNINAVRNVYNFCKKVKAKLVIQGMIVDWDHTWTNYNVPCFMQTVIWSSKKNNSDYLDLGTDNLHPGPLQHTYFADKFLELINKWY